MTSVVTSPSGARFTLFFSIRSPFSNFHPCTFKITDQTDDGTTKTQTFSCTEQYYMYHKALSSGDVETANEVMKEREARKIKMLGKNVKNFDLTKWETLCEDVMWRCSIAKYSQNDDLRNKLFCTHGSTLVECSPTDAVWGIGMDIHEPDAVDPSKWRGKNKLGHILTRVREHMWNQVEYAQEVAKAMRVVENLDQYIGQLFLPPKPKMIPRLPFHSTPNSNASSWNSTGDYHNMTWYGTSTSAITPIKRPASPAVLLHPEAKRRRMDGDLPISTNTSFPSQNTMTTAEHKRRHRNLRVNILEAQCILDNELQQQINNTLIYEARFKKGGEGSFLEMNTMRMRGNGWNREEQLPVRSDNQREDRGRTPERRGSDSQRRSESQRQPSDRRFSDRRSSRRQSSKRGNRWTSSSSSSRSRSRSRSRSKSRDKRHRRTHKRRSSRSRKHSYSDASDSESSRRTDRRKHSTAEDSKSDRRKSRKNSSRNRSESKESKRASDSESEGNVAKWQDNESLFTSLLQRLKRKPSGLWQKVDASLEFSKANELMMAQSAETLTE